MRRAAKFVTLSASDQSLLLHALATITMVRLRLALLPFRPPSGRRGARRVPKPAVTPERIAWAIGHAGGCWGNATCLARALAAQRMLRRRGVASRVSIGVVGGERQGATSSLIAHAWLEVGGRILVGGPDVSRYTPLLTWCN